MSVKRRAVPSARGTTDAVPGVGPNGEELTYSYPVQYFEFQSQRQTLRMAYLDLVPAAPNGASVVLLHGKNFSAEYWVPTIRTLVQAGFRVIAPDQIGFGKSSKPENYRYSFLELAGNTRALLQSLNLPTSAVVGHSMGGMLAARYAITFPEATAKLVLVNPLGLEDYGEYLPYRSVDDWYAKELAQTPEKIIEYQKRAYYGGAWKPEYQALAALQIGFTRHPAYPRVAYVAALTDAMIVSEPVVHDFGRIRAATRLIIGARDRTALGRDLVPEAVAAKMGDFPKLARAAKAAIPKADLVEIPSAGHLPQVEEFPRYAKALLDFLGSPPAALGL
jgi:pimeloyl-ACP methyl ester carboxylesterase